MSPKVTKELIFNYFMGNASAMQRQMIARWAREKANEEQFYVWLEEFETVHPEYEANLENAVQNYYGFLKSLNEKEALPGSRKAKVAYRPAGRPGLWRKWRGAAAVLLVLGAITFFGRDVWMFETHTTRIAERRQLVLPDGSSVVLGSNSMLKIPRWGFGTESRDVYLVGEAFFNVRHTAANRRFVVKTAKKIEVEVLGTEFNVVARKTGARVILKKGKVQLTLQDGPDSRKMALRPGDVFTMDSKNKTSLKTTTLPEIREAWKGHLYLFDKTSLKEIMSRLEEDHGIKAEFTDQGLSGHTISGKFTAADIDELFELIGGLLDVQITREGNKVKISHPRQ